MVFVDLNSDPSAFSQLVVKGHLTAIRGITKANQTMVLTSSIAPDCTLRLWDITTITDFARTSSETTTTGSLLLISALKGLSSTPIGHGFLNERIVIGVSKEGEVAIWDWKLSSPLSLYQTSCANCTAFMLFTDKEGIVIGTDSGMVVAYSVRRSINGYEFVKETEIQEQARVETLQSFRGNSDIIITALSSGEVKLLSKRTRTNYQTLSGCKSPIEFFVLTSVKAEPDIYLLSLEQFGFRIADIDGTGFSFVNTDSKNNYKFEKNGWPQFQILDATQGERVVFVTINIISKQSSLILWSLNSKKPRII